MIRGRSAELAWAALLTVGGSIFSPRSIRAQTPCDTASTQTQLTTCASTAAHRAEARLAMLVKEVSDSVGPTRATELEQVQTVWRMYRDQHCAWDSEAVAGGSMQPMWTDFCIAAITEARVQELKTSLCEGGGGDCEAARRYPPTKSRP